MLAYSQVNLPFCSGTHLIGNFGIVLHRNLASSSLQNSALVSRLPEFVLQLRLLTKLLLQGCSIQNFWVAPRINSSAHGSLEYFLCSLLPRGFATMRTLQPGKLPGGFAPHTPGSLKPLARPQICLCGWGGGLDRVLEGVQS